MMIDLVSESLAPAPIMLGTGDLTADAMQV